MARLMRGAAMIIATSVLMFPACSSPSSRSKQATGSKSDSASLKAKPDTNGQSAQRLHTLAEREQSGRTKAAQAGSIEIPVGVELEALSLRDVADTKARMSLLGAIAEASAVSESTPPETPSVQPDAAAQAEAMKLYAKGRAAAADRKHMQAVLDLQKALDLDPNSSAIMRELARSYVELNNASRAVELYERLAKIDPSNTEALFTLGLAAANRRDFPAAIGALGPHRAAGNSFSHDPGADILADFTLALALRELGYDRASIDATRAALNFPEQFEGPTEHAARLGSVYRQRGELWRAIGDAHCRLGEFDDAVTAYEAAIALPSTDPASLHPRLVYANLCLGRPYAAQAAVFDALAANPELASERDIRLCGYLAEHAKPTDVLAQSLGELARQHPDSSGLTRAAASMLPSADALALLKEFVARKPRDLDGVRQLLVWLAQRDAGQAVALTVSLADQQPDLFDEYAAGLLSASPSASALLSAMDNAKPSPTASRLHARILTKLGAVGEAWTVCAKARRAWPEDRTLLLQQVELAAALQEPRLLTDAVTEAEAVVNEVPGLVTLAKAHRAVGQTEKAVEFGQRAIDLDADSVDALLELARCETAHAVVLNTGENGAVSARAWIDKAVGHAERAIELDPSREEAYEVLAMVYSPGGALADTQLFRVTAQRLRDAVPNSALYGRLAAQEALGQRRFEQAVERLINLCEADPTDTTSLSLLITAWERWDRLERAEQWLDERTKLRPGDPALLEQWVRVKLLRDQDDLAIERLEALVAADPREYIARRLLETVYRSNGQLDAAMKLGEQRLLARPEGLRREIELAALYAGAERAGQAAERLRWVQQHAADASMDDLAAAITIAGRLPEGDSAHQALALELATATIESHPQAPLQVYGTALLALARAGDLGERFDAMAKQAAATSSGGAAGSLEAAANWRDLAQALTDAEHPAAAARALRAKLEATPTMDDRASAALIRIVLILDAASELKAVERGEPAQPFGEMSLATLAALDGKPALTRVVDTQETATLPTACYEVGVYFSILGATHGVETLLREAIRRQPDAAMAMNNLGYARLELDHTDADTIAMIEKAHELSSDEPNILDTIGWLRYKQGRFADEAAGTPGAKSLIQRSIELSDEPGAEVLDHLGDTQWRLGNKDEARQAWEKAAAMLEDPTFVEQTLQTFTQVQSRVWQIVVASPQELYDRQYGGVLNRVKAKLEALERGTAPEVEPLWGE